jgi:hypothetical protein
MDGRTDLDHSSRAPVMSTRPIATTAYQAADQRGSRKPPVAPRTTIFVRWPCQVSVRTSAPGRAAS